MQIKAQLPDFAARIEGIDVRTLSDRDVAALVAAIDHHGVLVFPSQSLSQAELVAFARQFGELDIQLNKDASGRLQQRLEEAALFDISNVDLSGEVAARNHAQVLNTMGSRVWHSDGAYKQHPYRYSILAAHIVPSWGGETQFADLRAAYDALDERTRAMVEPMVAEHDFYHWLVDRLGLPAPSQEERGRNPPVLWPLVRTHPGSGRKLLWVETAVSRILGLTVAEGRVLALDLLEHATQRERVYSHVWQPGEVVMWDNRSVVHRGRQFDLGERREMRRATVVGDDCALSADEVARLTSR